VIWIISLVIFVVLAVGVLLSDRFDRGVSPAASNSAGLTDAIGEAMETFTDEGKILVHGELWRAASARGVIEKGSKVRVIGYLEGLVLKVERVE